MAATRSNSSQKTGRLQALLNAHRKLNEDLDLNLSAGGETQRGMGGTRLTSTTSGGFQSYGYLRFPTRKMLPRLIQTTAENILKAG
jgi:hypothetical protein